MKKLLRWIGVIAWMGVIFYFSHQPDLKSGLETVWDTFFRKIAHVSEFFVLTYFLFLAWREYRVSRARIFVLSASVAAFYAAADEFHQSFTHGRHASPVDVAIDCVGVALCLALLYRKSITHPL